MFFCKNCTHGIKTEKFYIILKREKLGVIYSAKILLSTSRFYDKTRRSIIVPAMLKHDDGIKWRVRRNIVGDY